MKQKPLFIINSACKSSIATKLDTHTFEALLNTNIQLSEYGPSIEQILFTFIAASEEDNIEEKEQQVYLEADKTLEIKLSLPYKQLVSAEDATTKEWMAALFLKSIPLYADMDLPDFDWQVFYIDIKTLLVKEKWLEPNIAVNQQFLLDFGIGGRDWIAMGKKMSHFYQIEKSLNRYMDLSDYGTSMHQLQCAFVALPSTSIVPHTSIKEYEAAKKWVKIVFVVDYEALLQADEYSLLNLLGSYLLKAILQIAELQIADFDWKNLYRHIRWLLIIEEWLDESLTLVEKTSITGLPSSLIKRIESNVDTVRVGAVKTYCEKLKVPYSEVVPELAN